MLEIAVIISAVGAFDRRTKRIIAIIGAASLMRIRFAFAWTVNTLPVFGEAAAA